jgi:hypothetical protein
MLDAASSCTEYETVLFAGTHGRLLSFRVQPPVDRDVAAPEFFRNGSQRAYRDSLLKLVCRRPRDPLWFLLRLRWLAALGAVKIRVAALRVKFKVVWRVVASHMVLVMRFLPAFEWPADNSLEHDVRSLDVPVLHGPWVVRPAHVDISLLARRRAALPISVLFSPLISSGHSVSLSPRPQVNKLPGLDSNQRLGCPAQLTAACFSARPPGKIARATSLARRVVDRDRRTEVRVEGSSAFQRARCLLQQFRTRELNPDRPVQSGLHYRCASPNRGPRVGLYAKASPFFQESLLPNLRSTLDGFDRLRREHLRQCFVVRHRRRSLRHPLACSPAELWVRPAGQVRLKAVAAHFALELPQAIHFAGRHLGARDHRESLLIAYVLLVVYFAVAVRAEQIALVQLLNHRIELADGSRDRKLLGRTVAVVKVECRQTTIVAAPLASPALVVDGRLLQFSMLLRDLPGAVLSVLLSLCHCRLVRPAGLEPAPVD